MGARDGEDVNMDMATGLNSGHVNEPDYRNSRFPRTNMERVSVCDKPQCVCKVI
jgi:hypothetical protein